MNLFHGLSAEEKLLYYRAVTQLLNLYTPPNNFGGASGYGSLKDLKKKMLTAKAASRLKPESAIYIHIPFCKKRRCTFCMYSSTTCYSKSDVRDYVKRLFSEYVFWHELMPKKMNSLYVGGGTPSILSPKEMEQAFSFISNFHFDDRSERTCELSPSTATPSHLSCLRQLGFTKVSFGVQSLSPATMNAVNREYVPLEKIKKLIVEAERQHFYDINVDIMLGLPWQSTRNLLSELKRLCETGILSLTLYAYRNLHATSLAEEKKRKKKIHEYLNAIFEQMQRLGWKHEAGNLETEYNCFASSRRTITLKPHITGNDGFRNYCLWGLGAQAVGFTPSFSYRCRSFSTSFSDSEKRYEIFEYNQEQQMRTAACTMLYAWNMKVKNVFFQEAFGKNFEEIFPREIDDLFRLHKIKSTEYGFHIEADSLLDAAALLKFFWDQDYLSSLVEGVFS